MNRNTDCSKDIWKWMKMTRLHVLRLPISHLNGPLRACREDSMSSGGGIEQSTEVQETRENMVATSRKKVVLVKCPWNMLTQIPGLRRQVSVVWFNYCCNPPCDYPGGFGMVCRSKLYGGCGFSQLPCFRKSHVPSENGTCMYVLVMNSVSPKSMVYGNSWKTPSKHVQHV